MTTNCLRCGTPAKAPTPEWTAVQLCDRCFGDVMHYITETDDPRLSVARVKAARRLYAVQGRDEDQTAELLAETYEEEVCDPDYDPTDAELAPSPAIPVAEQHKAAWDLKTGWM